MEKLYYKEYYKLERKHWWFTARLKILRTVLSRFVSLLNTDELEILNAGAATGATSVMLQEFGRVISLEYDKGCYEFLKEVIEKDVVNGSLTELEYQNETFDMVCAFDVIEHIEDHEKAVSEIYRVLKKDGLAYITVPAFQFLWSDHDVINHHFRRYTKKEIVDLFKNQGFKIDFETYFNFVLFFPIFLVRMISNMLPTSSKSNSTGSDAEKIGATGPLNKILFQLMKSELLFLGRKISLPVGVSVLLIARKQ